MSFSFLVWNVENFRGNNATRRQRVADLIGFHNPNVFCIIEFQAKNAARSLIANHFTQYDFGVTDSKRSLELLVGWRRGKFQQLIFTQRREFLAGDIDLRPGGGRGLLIPAEACVPNESPDPPAPALPSSVSTKSPPCPPRSALP